MPELPESPPAPSSLPFLFPSTALPKKETNTKGDLVVVVWSEGFVAADFVGNQAEFLEAVAFE